MALTPGTRLGVYDITAHIGEGGMGAVYRAIDTSLGRQVAIKVLPDAFAQDAQRLARFEREAKTLAALNHPNIAAIYGLERSSGTQALVMELVEGDDLSQRIARGAISIDEALPIAKQIADALEAAHEHGIIHRDLKPANIKVRADGTVKVLDFGLAKAMEPPAGSSPGVSMSPTITTPAMTRAGMILGTAAYMSPEQAKGRTVDRRADVWAFGAVLYEMLTGQRAFAGDDVSETFVAIMRDEPDWARLPATLSPSLRTCIRRCLHKDPKQRIPDLATMRLALEGAFDQAAPQMTGTSTPVAGRGRLAWAVATLTVIGLATVSFLRVRETPVEQRRVHLSVPLPGNAAPGFFALSPDGRSLVMRYQNGLANGLEIRSLESGEIRLLTGAEGARTPFWSPDNVASLGDANGRRLLTDPSSAVFVPNGPGSSQGRLLFVREQTLMAQTFDTISLQLSGEPVTVANHVSFTNAPPQIAVSADTNGTVVYLTNGRPERQLIWYDRSGTERGRAATTGSGPATAVSLAPDGKRVAFRRTDAQGLVSLWVQDLERNQETRLTTPPLSPSAAVWAPDSQRIAFRATGAGADGIYIKNVNGGKEAMLLPGSNSWAPSDWSRDDHSLVYTEDNPKTGADIWLLADPSKPSAERKPVPMLRTPSVESQGQSSPDGKWLAYVSNESGTSQVYLRPFGGLSPASDTRWQVSSVNGAEPRWRADGKELFFLLATQRDKAKVVAVPIGAAPNPAGTPTPLFEFQSLSTIAQSNAFRYSPAADGQRFLVNADATAVQPSLEVILNWGRTSSAK